MRASGQAPDGMTVRDSANLPVLDSRGTAERCGTHAKLRNRWLQRIKALIAAPVGESYSGPVLFEGSPAAQIMAEVLDRNWRCHEDQSASRASGSVHAKRVRRPDRLSRAAGLH